MNKREEVLRMLTQYDIDCVSRSTDSLSMIQNKFADKILALFADNRISRKEALKRCNEILEQAEKERDEAYRKDYTMPTSAMGLIEERIQGLEERLNNLEAKS